MMTSKQKKAIQLIAEAAELLGWEVSFNAKSNDVNYIIVGKPKIIDKLISKIEKKK